MIDAASIKCCNARAALTLTGSVVAWHKVLKQIVAIRARCKKSVKVPDTPQGCVLPPENPRDFG